MLMCNHQLSITGYDLLGPDGREGLRYAWRNQDSKYFVESAAFPQRSVSKKDDICGYTTSVSAGCALRTFGAQCLFCRTGNIIPFGGLLSYRDIAKQNIFMVLSDMFCSDHPELRNRPREFAYMGQGEPGLSYPQVRLAIELTNRAMRELRQTVYRHVFATSGVPESIEAFKDDIKNKYYTRRVTLHFSLHATSERALIMPIEKHWSYKESLFAMRDMVDLTGEKPCVGIMLFKDFCPHRTDVSYSNELDRVKEIVSELDPQRYRLSFCTYNATADISSSSPYPKEEAEKVLDYVRSIGFEAKLFSSFGRKEQTACGTLGGKMPRNFPPAKWFELETMTEDIISRLV